MRYLATVTIGPELVLQITRDQIHSPFVSALFESCEISTYLMQGTAAFGAVALAGKELFSEDLNRFIQQAIAARFAKERSHDFLKIDLAAT